MMDGFFKKIGVNLYSVLVTRNECYEYTSSCELDLN